MTVSRGHARPMRVVAAGAAMATLALAGCNRSGGGTVPPVDGGGGVGQTTTTMAHDDGHTDDHGAGGGHTDDHGVGGGSTGGTGGGTAGGGGHAHENPEHLNHDPTPEQLDKARKLVADTRAAAKRLGLDSVAGLKANGYVSIGDEFSGTTHYVKPPFHYDPHELNPDYIEAFAVRQNRVVAAMYILSNGKTMADVPDIAGNVTVWHDHRLPFRGTDPTKADYYQLGGRNMRQTAPMLHVWLEANRCGAFAGTDTGNMTGSCKAVIN